MDEDEEPPLVPMVTVFAATASQQLVGNDPMVKALLDRKVLTKDVAHASAGVTPAHADHNQKIKGQVISCDGYTCLAIEDAWDDKKMVFVHKGMEEVAQKAGLWLEKHTHVTALDDRSAMQLRIGNEAHVGYNTYMATFASKHDKHDQESSTVLLKAKVFKKGYEGRAKPLQDLEAHVRNDLNKVLATYDQCAVLDQAHVLRQGDLHACPSSHTDVTKDTPKAEISSIVNLSRTASSMFVVGAKEDFEYTKVGDAASMPSAMYHYTSSACTGTVKIAFFYEIHKTEDVDSAARASEPSEEAKGSKKRKTDDESEQDSSTTSPAKVVKSEVKAENKAK